MAHQGFYAGQPPGLRNAVSRTAATASAQFTNPFDPLRLYRITGEQAFWYKWAVTGGSAAAGADDAVLVQATDTVFDSPPSATEVYLHVIRVSADGYVNVAEMQGRV